LMVGSLRSAHPTTPANAGTTRQINSCWVAVTCGSLWLQETSGCA